MDQNPTVAPRCVWCMACIVHGAWCMVYEPLLVQQVGDGTYVEVVKKGDDEEGSHRHHDQVG